jgi:hypothetical protein
MSPVNQLGVIRLQNQKTVNGPGFVRDERGRLKDERQPSFEYLKIDISSHILP